MDIVLLPVYVRKPQIQKPPYKGEVPAGKKYCPDCETIQDLALFTSKTGKSYAYCHGCRNKQSRQRYKSETGLRHHLLRTYGLTKEEYEALLASQGGVCACCGEPERILNKHTGKVQRLSVDHHHVSGEVRSLLCNACNYIIGYIENNSPGRVEKALTYIQVQENAGFKKS